MAHSEEELDEWKERYRWRFIKKEAARKQHLYSYMDMLIDDYNSATDRLSVVCLLIYFIIELLGI